MGICPLGETIFLARGGLHGCTFAPFYLLLIRVPRAVSRHAAALLRSFACSLWPPVPASTFIRRGLSGPPRDAPRIFGASDARETNGGSEVAT